MITKSPIINEKEVKRKEMENIKSRKSVRTYTSEDISPELKEQLAQYLLKLEEEYKGKFRFPIIDTKGLSNQKIGTYGVIRGARYFVCGIVKKDTMDLLELGYVFEKIILFASSLGLGTCWLGGTFERSNFAKSVNLKEEERFIVTTPIGYEESKKSLTEKAMRKMAGSDNRKKWEELFFDGSKKSPLEKKELGAFKEVLEMVRIGPSASNKQPWRIVKNENRYDFFLERTPDYAKSLDFDIQMLDMGIAICHFETALKEQKLTGKFKKVREETPSWPEGEYIISWQGLDL